MFTLFLPMTFPQKFPQSNSPQHPTASWHRAHRARAQNVGGASPRSPRWSPARRAPQSLAQDGADVTTDRNQLGRDGNNLPSGYVKIAIQNCHL